MTGSRTGVSQPAYLSELQTQMDAHSIGRQIHALIAELYPICRSITGDGVRETLQIIGRHISLAVQEIPTGTQVFDWVVPKEWNIRDAYVGNANGERVIDFRRSNLHVVGYSKPIRGRMTLSRLREHLFTLPEHPDWIPYRTAYYRESWGFCLTHRQYEGLPDEEYEVVIDASLEAGSLTYGECFLAGETDEEVLISAHVCHPALCNDNLSGVAVATYLGAYLATRPRRYSYRILFAPTTIGAIAWLARNEAQATRIRHGLVLSCVGDRGRITYKKSRHGAADVDRAAAHVLAHSGADHEILEFSPYGYDERQFCSPGFDLPVGCFMRTPNGRFPEYHTSGDDLEFVSPESVADSFATLVSILSVLERNVTYANRNPKCEPQLGKRGLYPTPGSKEHLATLWVLNLSDGTRSLLDIAERADLPFTAILDAAEKLEKHGLLTRVGSAKPRG